MADWNKMSPLGVSKFLRNLVQAGGHDPFDVALSPSTEGRRLHNSRDTAMHKIASQRFGSKLVIHFDGIRVELGPYQGGGKREHICISSTGIGGEKRIAIMVAENGSGFITIF